MSEFEIGSAHVAITPGSQLISSIPRFIPGPLSSPERYALGLINHRFQDGLLPISESRNGNKYYAAFHTLCSGIGVQALLLPVAFTTLGPTWGVISLCVAFLWQLFTICLLLQLHETSDTRIRYSRYIQVFNVAFDNKVGKMVVWLSIMFLSGSTCLALIVIGGSTLTHFMHSICNIQALSTVELYLIFTCAVVIVSQLPNLNSLAYVSFVGAITAVGYCSFIWVVSVATGPIALVSYEPVRAGSQIEQMVSVVNALGNIAFAFRGHNLILEIQATMPSDEKYFSQVPMWKGVVTAYSIILFCIFPVAIGGYWAYGNKIANVEGMLCALYKFHSHDVSQFMLGLISVFIVINALTSFPIYAMPTFDNMESNYTSRTERPCPWWLRVSFRALFGFGCFVTAVAMPISGGIVCLAGSMTLPVTLSYPCFMWLKIKKPRKYTTLWWLNWGLGLLGMGFSCLLVASGIHLVIHTGIQANFFKPRE
ncbi:lysine histidine transporter-like 8 [Pistacia vera]|uniref:lysine histidine transporter-like 8 n=1 Tax=Pistacia vera TaxID=55513 RepID=UPI001262B0F0|nr:lysine histidine transporter-like 8 [Pistacia vera]